MPLPIHLFRYFVQKKERECEREICSIAKKKDSKTNTETDGINKNQKHKYN